MNVTTYRFERNRKGLSWVFYDALGKACRAANVPMPNYDGDFRSEVATVSGFFSDDQKGCIQTALRQLKLEPMTG